MSRDSDTKEETVYYGAEIHVEQVQEEPQHPSHLSLSTKDHCVDHLATIASTCLLLSSIHTEHALNAKKYHNILTLPSIIVAAVGAAIAYVPVGNGVDVRGPDWIPIFIAMISTVNTVLVGFINYFKFQQTATAHTEAAKNYILLGGEIRDYLVKMPTSSTAWLHDLQIFRKKKEDILMSAPLVSN